MASGSQGPKQTRGYFVPLGNCVDKVFQYSNGAGAGGSFLPGAFSAASWETGNAYVSSISSIGAGGLLRDMGKTIQAPIGNGANPSVGFFRQVQLLLPSALTAAQGYNGGLNGNTFGVTGVSYLTFYVPTVVLGIAGVAAATAQDLVGAGGAM